MELQDDDPEVVKAMMYYIYHFDYSYPQTEPNSIPRIVFDVYMHTIADKYDIDGLMKVAATKFTARTKSEWKTPGFAEAINEVYTVAADPYRELRDAIVEVCSKKAKDISTEDFGASIRDAANSLPSFGGDMFNRLAGRPSSLENEARYRCGGCAQTFAMTKISEQDTRRNNGGYRSCPYCSNRFSGTSWASWEADKR